MEPDGAAAPVAAQPEPPEELICPITACLMEDPVMTMDGYTYEREAIEAWFRNNNTSPLTREVIPTTLVPNRNLKSQIESWKE